MEVTVERSGSLFRVRVVGDRETIHRVDADLSRLPKEVQHADPARLVAESFEFPLEREPNTSILSRFALSDIGRYCPEYFDWLAKRHLDNDAN